LRYLTQAGGRMASDRVQRFARLGGDRGWELFVMYGQTEATARMAYLPPELAMTRPTCVGRAIPGGRFRLIGSEEIEESGQSADREIGELVYEGPNVMLGYATELADLARGRDVYELRTGDLARVDSVGLVEIVGRLGRTAKVQGLRIDLGRLENRLGSEGFGVNAVQAGTQLGLVGMYEGHREPALVSLAGEFTGLARTSILCRRVDQVPRLSSGKPDYRVLAQVAMESRSAAVGGAEYAGVGVPEAELVELFAQLLGRTEVDPTSSFVSLGGDSLSFVAVCAALEGRVGTLPRNWPQLSIRELALLPGPASRPGARSTRRLTRRSRRRVETSTLLRAIAIVAVVGSHIGVFDLRGGAQLLFAIVGYNFARFHLTSAGRIERLNRATRALGRVLFPALLWLLPLVLFTSHYSPSVLMVNNLFGPDFGDAPEWRYWFIEAMAYILIAVVVVLAVPVADRWERQNPLVFPLMTLGVGVGLAAMTEPGTPGGTRSPVAFFWVFALGWALGKAVSRRQRVAVILLAVVLAPWLIGQADRSLFLVGGLALLGCLAFVPVPRFVAWALIELAGASLIIYLTHWQVYPLIVGGERAESAAEGWPALVVSLAFGVMAWRLASRVMVGLKGQPVNSARCLHKMITKRVSESILLTPTR
ncbi:MAG: AMP-binding protein, partial [Candidatus Nanopelagicales bacterium]|nr:AMP-binding protein [Candidatus Nanopelagicales bacterium]